MMPTANSFSSRPAPTGFSRLGMTDPGAFQGAAGISTTPGVGVLGVQPGARQGKAAGNGSYGFGSLRQYNGTQFQGQPVSRKAPGDFTNAMAFGAGASAG